MSAEPYQSAAHDEWTIAIYDDQPVAEGKTTAPEMTVLLTKAGKPWRKFTYPSYRIWTLLAHWTDDLDVVAQVGPDPALTTPAPSSTTPAALSEPEREMLLKCHVCSARTIRHRPEGGLGPGSFCQQTQMDILVAAVERILTDRLADLRRWKAEATTALNEWDEVFEALGKPGQLGDSKAAASLAALAARALVSEPDGLAERLATTRLEDGETPLGEIILSISNMIDSTYPASLDPEAHLLRRVFKIAEEAGEVVEALFGTLGENPRKGHTHTMDDVRSELLDVALAALAAIAHFDAGDTVGYLIDHAEQVASRLEAALAAPVDAEVDCG